MDRRRYGVVTAMRGRAQLMNARDASRTERLGWSRDLDPDDGPGGRLARRLYGREPETAALASVLDAVGRGGARLLSLDSTKAQTLLGWQPVWGIDDALQHTSEWYRTWLASGDIASDRQLDQYIKDAAAIGTAWCGA